jgi:hypothetical protein
MYCVVSGRMRKLNCVEGVVCCSNMVSPFRCRPKFSVVVDNIDRKKSDIYQAFATILIIILFFNVINLI